MYSGQTYWLIGASEGLGRALAQQLSDAGATLILSARSADRLQALANSLPRARVLAFDVCDPQAVADAFAQAGEFDGVIYCAGFYEPMRAQDWQADKVDMMLDVNFNGAVRVLGHVVPAFLRKDRGHIVLIGSLAAFRGLPGAIGYGASKAALMHLGENLYADLGQTGVKVSVINPGFIRTRLTDKNDFNMPAIQTPEAAAKAVQKAMQSNRPVQSFPFWFSLVFRVGRFLPAGMFRRLMKGSDTA